MCHLVLVFFSPFSIEITSLGEEKTNLGAFRACLDLSVFSSAWCLRRAAVCYCGTPWTFLLPFLHSIDLCSGTLWLNSCGPCAMFADCRLNFTTLF